ncbi:MAG: DUF3325 domain-containing protein [Sphingobium sp.]
MMMIVFVLSYLGLTGLSLGMRRHYAQLFKAENPVAMKAMRIVGWCLLVTSLILGLQAEYWLFGLLEWIGLVVASGLMIIFSLALKPRICPVLALSSLLLVVFA